MVVYIFFFFTHCFEFQNIVLVSFFSKTVFNLGNQIAGGQNLYQPPNHCRIVSERYTKTTVIRELKNPV